MIAGQYDKVILATGFGQTTADAVEAIGFKGKVVIVGMGKLETTLNVMTMIQKQVTVKGSNGGTNEDIAGVYAKFATGKLNPTLTIIKFEEIGEGLEQLKAGKVKGRLVALI